jgi:DNA-binding response OmpR family regulator
MDCPHCGADIASRLKPIEHEVFDDVHRRIVVDGLRARLRPGGWRMLTALRERYRKVVPKGYLAEQAARDPADGGSISSVKVHICWIRHQLRRTPFRIRCFYGDGYALFPAVETIEEEDKRQ